MDYQITSDLADGVSVPCLLLGFYHKRRLTESGARINALLDGLVENLLKRDELEGKAGDVLIIPHTGHPAIERIVLVGLGKKDELSAANYRKALAAAARELGKIPVKVALSALHEAEVLAHDQAWNVSQFIQTVEASFYRFTQCKSDGDKNKPKVADIRFWTEQARMPLDEAIRQGVAIARGVTIARELSNLPGNICTPRYLAEEAVKLGKHHKKLKVKVLGEADIESLGMGAFLSVSRGSTEAARFIVMEYSGASAKARPHVLVGKGLTFDAGGISIKPSAGMDEMKFDMCGGASVIGTLAAVADLDLPLNVIGLIPASENLPSGSANKPGDIVTSMAGITIEILNTDAEGRLLLCDALDYAKRYEAAAVIDVATLTGACVVALGRHPSGLWSNNEKLASALLDAGESSCDRVWRMPLWDEYQDQLKSNFADVANIGGPDGGSVTAACFLSRFTKDYPWAHVDIAGTAWKTGADKGATGRPVPLLVQYLLDQA